MLEVGGKREAECSRRQQEEAGGATVMRQEQEEAGDGETGRASSTTG